MEQKYRLNQEKFESSLEFRKSFYDQLLRLLDELLNEEDNEVETLRDLYAAMDDAVFESYFLNLENTDRELPTPKKNRKGFLACPFCAYLGHESPEIIEYDGYPYRAFYECVMCGGSAPCSNETHKTKSDGTYLTHEEVHAEAKALWNSRRLYGHADDGCYLSYHQDEKGDNSETDRNKS